MSMVDVDDLADKWWFVVATYVVAFLPWAIYSAIDHVDGRWRGVSHLANQTFLAATTFTVSLITLTAYVVVQFVAGDWKEAMAAIVVLLASWLPLQRVCRQIWILRANKALGQVLSGISTQPMTRWNPRNSNKFFDNDRPGEGVTDISLFAWWKEWRGFLAALKSLSSSPCALGDAEFGLSRIDHRNAMAVVRFRLRMVTALTGQSDVDVHPATGADNGMKRLVWLFDNLHGHTQIMQSLVSLGLCVSLCKDLCYGVADSSWLGWLEGDERYVYMQDGHLRYCHMLQATQIETELPHEDYHEVFTLLPAERASAEGFRHFKWQHVMYLVSSTLELHALTGALSSPAGMGQAGTLAFVRQHVLGAVAGNSVRVRPLNMFAVTQFLAMDSTTRVFESLQGEDGDRSRWESLKAHADSIAEALTANMQKRGHVNPASIAEPIGALRRVLTDVQRFVV